MEADLIALLDTISHTADLVVEVTGLRIRLLNRAAEMLAAGSVKEGREVHEAARECSKIEAALTRSLHNLTVAFCNLEPLSVHQGVKDPLRFTDCKRIGDSNHGEHG